MASRNFDTNTQRTPSFFDSTTYFYGWKNSEADPDKDFKVLYDDLATVFGFSGTPGSVPFVGSGGSLTEDNANLYYDEIQKFVGIGTNTPNALIDVLSPNTTSADLVVNFATTTRDIFRIYGDSVSEFRRNTTVNFGETAGGTTPQINTNASGRATFRNFNITSCRLGGDLICEGFDLLKVDRFSLDRSIASIPASAGTNFLHIKTGTEPVPTASSASAFFYCQRIGGSGAAAPYVKAEDGSIVQLYPESGTGETVGFTAGAGTSVNDDSTFTGNVGATAYRINDIVKALKNIGLLAQ